MTSSPVECFVRSFANGRPLGLLTLSSAFAVQPRTDLLHRAVVYEQAWRAQGTESSKNLGQVRGTTRKPFPQKGRGKARAGTLRAAHFVGGYAAHGPRPGISLPDIQRKVYASAIRSSIATKWHQNQLIVVDSLELPTNTKKSLMERLDALNLLGKKCYLLYGSQEPLVGLTHAADQFIKKPRSIDVPHGEKKLLVTSADLVSVLPVLENEYLVVDKAAIEALEEKYRVD